MNATTLGAYIGIYPEWNVKFIFTSLTILCEYNWNISRMECKEFFTGVKRHKDDKLEYIQNGM